jgi:hypothetical protein
MALVAEVLEAAATVKAATVEAETARVGLPVLTA